MLNEIAPKGDDPEQLPIKIDFTGFHVSIQKCKNRLEFSETSVYVSNILVTRLSLNPLLFPKVCKNSARLLSVTKA